MSRLLVTCGLLAMTLLTGCASVPESQFGKRSSATAATPAWNKYHIAGSRIPRTLDAQGQPLTGSHVVTITDQDLQSSPGILLGDKLAGGYPR